MYPSPKAHATVLVVDDEPGIRSFLSEVLIDAGHEVVQATNAAEALARLEDRPFDVMVLDLKMPGSLGGMDVLRRARAEWPEVQIIVLSAHGTVRNAVEAMRIGAFDFLEKPIEGPAALRRLVSRALSWRGNASRVMATPESLEPAHTNTRSTRIKHFLWQLKRRHVYNVGATYAAVAFVGLQGVEAVLPALPVPGWSYTALAWAFLLGFPVALVLGWVYDITASGVRRTRTETFAGKA